MDFYKTYADRYRAADDQTRDAARAHWTKCHAANMQTGRNDMIIFSGQILATIAVIDAGNGGREARNSVQNQR